jgi:pimeloyl-ACP methyl ester carboxylesterase
MKKLLLLCLPFLMVACIPTEIELPSGITQIENVNYFAFEPATTATTGFIFYPGAGVTAESYNSWLETLAEEGYLTVSTKMPLNLAVLDVNAARRIQNDFPDIDRWILGGHSLGGAMSIELIQNTLSNNPFDGLVLLAAYPGATADVSDWNGQVLSLSGSNDLVTTPNEIEEGKTRLPNGSTVSSVSEFTAAAGTIYYEILGANHAQFGNYGAQNGDGTATISSEFQQTEVVNAIHSFFELNGW